MEYNVRCSHKAACKCNMHTGMFTVRHTNKSQQRDHASCPPAFKPHITITRHHLMLALVTRNTGLYVCCKHTCGRQRLGAGHIGAVPGLRLTWPSAAALQSSVCMVVWRICVRSILVLLRSAAYHGLIPLHTQHRACSQALTSCYCVTHVQKHFG